MPLDPLTVSIILALARECAAFIAREGRPPTEDEIRGMFDGLKSDNAEFKDLLGH